MKDVWQEELEQLPPAPFLVCRTLMLVTHSLLSSLITDLRSLTCIAAIFLLCPLQTFGGHFLRLLSLSVHSSSCVSFHRSLLRGDFNSYTAIPGIWSKTRLPNPRKCPQTPRLASSCVIIALFTDTSEVNYNFQSLFLCPVTLPATPWLVHSRGNRVRGSPSWPRW